MTAAAQYASIMIRHIALLVFAILWTRDSFADETTGLDALTWLAGEWIGEGMEGEGGVVAGVARLYWTPPLEGSISYYFTWHAEASAHVHYAVTVFQQTDDGVVGKGIHYGSDFENFEEQPWQLKAVNMTPGNVEFACLQHCRSESVSFSLGADGVLEERWLLDPELQQPDWIVRYRRVE